MDKPSASKEDIAREIAERDGIKAGLVCVLTAVEPCRSFDIQRNREKKELELVSRWRKCLHLYHYYQHPQFGLIHMRTCRLDFDIVCDIIGKPPQVLPRLNCGTREHYSKYFDAEPEARPLFDEIFANDIQMFGYPYVSSGGAVIVREAIRASTSRSSNCAIKAWRLDRLNRGSPLLPSSSAEQNAHGRSDP